MPQTLVPLLTPHGALRLEASESDFSLDEAVGHRLEAAFARGGGFGLLQLGLAEAGSRLTPEMGFWRAFAMRFVAAVCAAGEANATEAPRVSELPAEAIERLVEEAPPMRGGEYLDAEILAGLWRSLQEAIDAEIAESGLTFGAFLAARDSRWRLVGRVHFHLAENRKDADRPFAFLATYAASLGAGGALRHAPLGAALREYAGAGASNELLRLLEPVQRASDDCGWLKAIVDSGEIFHPLRWTPGDAMRMLSDAEALERAGLVLRMPAGWPSGRPSRPAVEATVGKNEPSVVGAAQLLDFQVDVSLDGEPLTDEEIERLVASTEGLALLRGKWVEVDPTKLKATLDRYAEIERIAFEKGLSFGQAMRLVAGADIGEAATASSADWAHVNAGPWLAETLAACRKPETLAAAHPGAALKANLRPYQDVGLRWLGFLSRLGLGACLADDMGLGKTVQVLALLLTLHGGEARAASDRFEHVLDDFDYVPPASSSPQTRGSRGDRTSRPLDPRVRGDDGVGRSSKPSLIVAPASLLANWAAEAERFAPSLKVLVAHPAFTPAERLADLSAETLAATDLIVTSYGALLRYDWIAETHWRLAVIDEAQAIKNPDAKQTRAVKKLQAESRIALTGTPIENDLRDLWSIFDFLNPGLLGSSKAFAKFVKRLGERTPPNYAPLRKLVAPYILRRLKTDRSVISDLPDKTEAKAYCALSRKQAAIYQATVKEFEARLKESTEPMGRRGLVLSTLMRLKQICNHASHGLGGAGHWEIGDSGKFARLAEIAATVASRQEKMLVFTQFTEGIAPLGELLTQAFGRPGLSLAGDTAVGKRRALVKTFQEDERTPFFILSLKAGGSGLNLTAASHVVHFDRWWNPAVENQATDRAFRIGQKRNVLVHKFVCRGTIEERIDQLIESKRQMADEMLSGGGEINLTELGDADLLALVRLDLDAATKDG